MLTDKNLPWPDVPSTIPAMLDIRLIRDQPDFVKSRVATRGGEDALKIGQVLEVDVARRKAETAVQELNGQRKSLSKKIGAMRGRNEPTAEIEAQVRKIGDDIVALNDELSRLDEKQRGLLLQIPNLPHAAVPEGADASGNKLVRQWGEKPAIAGDVQDHVKIGERLGLLISSAPPG